MLSRVGVLGAALILAFMPPVLAREAPPTVVELFTSQGCSSCPPADAFLGELAGRDDVIALSFHVDYWDYLGWKDPFSSRAATERQRAYMRSLHGRMVYTPQMVIDGRVGAVGSRREEILRIIARERQREHTQVPIEATLDENGLVTLRIPRRTFDGTAAVWFLEFVPRRVTRVAAGENEGRTLTDHNVVRTIRRLGTWTGKPFEVTVSLGELAQQGDMGCAVLVQQGDVGPILGAARLMVPRRR